MQKGQIAGWRIRRPDSLKVRVLVGTALLFVLTAIFATDVDDFIYPNDLLGRNLTDLVVIFGVVLPVFYVGLLRPLLRLLDERRRSEEASRLRARELAAVHAVSEVATRELDLERLLARVLDIVLSVFEAQGGWLLMPGKRPASAPRVVVSRGIPAVLEKAEQGDPCLDCQACCWQKMEQLPPGEITLLPECRDLPREVLLRAGFAGFVGILLPVGRRVRAILNLVWRAPRELDEADRALLRAMARQIGIAAENLALFEAEQSSRKVADTITSVGLAMSASLDLDAVLRTLLEHIGRFVPYDRAAVMLLDEESRLTVQAERLSPDVAGTSEESFASLKVLQTPLVREVMETRRSLCVADAAAQTAASGRPQEGRGHSWLGVPLLAAGRAIGLLKLMKAEPAFYTPEQVKLAEGIAAPAAVAIANARHFGEVLTGRETLGRLSRRLVDVQESERRHLARELHDEIGQSLTAVLYRLAAARSSPSPRNDVLDEAMEITKGTMRSVRNISMDLRPTLLDEAGLAETLRWYIDRQVRSDSLDVGLSVSPELGDLPLDVRTACFRIVQEALTNVMRHAEARHVQVRLGSSGSRIEIGVSDDGRGFDVAEAYQLARTGGSLGILGMKERAEHLGGKVDFESRPGAGTTMTASVPIPEPN
jgi:signal transduction histidine kinase